MDEDTEPSPRRRWAWVAAAALALPLGFLAVLWTTSLGQGTEVYCEAWGAIPSGETVDFGDVALLVDEPIKNRDPCNGDDDLWHYSPGDLGDADGVLFDSCDISWVAGGRSTAAAEGIPC